jgi:hypothetical protein
MSDSLTPKQVKGIITSSMFGKAKYAADGKFDKFQSRIVAGGHLQDRNIPMIMVPHPLLALLVYLYLLLLLLLLRKIERSLQSISLMHS